MTHTVLVVIAVIAIVVYVIGRQLLGEPLRGKRVILLPLVLTVLGAVDLGQGGRHLQTVDIGLIVLSAVIAAAIVFGQGAIMRLERRDGGLWGQLPGKGLWLWGALVASRVIIAIVADASGAQVAASTASILLVLGVNRLAQAASITPARSGPASPFAPEKDGSTFLAGLGTRAPNPNHLPSPPEPPAASPTAASWAATGVRVATAVGGALQDRRGRRRQRGTDDRRNARGRRTR